MFTCRLDPYSRETTPINQIFGGYMRTEGKQASALSVLREAKCHVSDEEVGWECSPIEGVPKFTHSGSFPQIRF